MIRRSQERPPRAVRVRVRGRVQGVWFRGWVVDEASVLGLDGWVRNRVDGGVELVVAGPPAAVARMIEACAKGPPAARVDAVEVAELDDLPDLAAGFAQRPTV